MKNIQLLEYGHNALKQSIIQLVLETITLCKICKSYAILSYISMYSQTCFIRPLQGERKCGLLRQVVF